MRKSKPLTIEERVWRLERGMAALHELLDVMERFHVRLQGLRREMEELRAKPARRARKGDDVPPICLPEVKTIQ